MSLLILLTFIICLIMYDDDIVGGSAWVMERHGWKEIVIIVLLDHFAQVTGSAFASKDFFPKRLAKAIST